MQQTPKINKKILSLGNKKNVKRQNETPKRFLRSSQQTSNPNNVKFAINVETPRSPSVISISSDNGIECTPPHRRLNLDDSIDFSPKSFDSSFSPSNLLSQTLAIDSPEVGWRWARRSSGANESDSMVTPVSGYANDSSYSSGIDSNGKTNEKADSLKSFNNGVKREDYRRNYELEIRKAEKTKAEEMLKKRCAKLQEQLKEAEMRSSKCDKFSTKLHCESEKSPPTFGINYETDDKVPVILKNNEKSIQKELVSLEKENFDDFFNDSDMDCFLLEATQQCESNIEHSHKKKNTNSKPSESPKIVDKYITTPTATPKPTPNKEKRTSLYMQFLEDDFNDDWLATLDEEVIKATQPKKPRTSLQRYKSMPSDSISEAAGSPSNGKTLTKNFPNEEAVKGTPKFKRHSSSHAITPSSSNHRLRQKKC